MKVVIIGGVAAGTKAAAKLLREDRSNQVQIITKSKDISYAGCGLPYYVGHVIERREQLIVNTPQSFTELTGVSVATQTEAVAIDREKKLVVAVDAVTGERREYPYDKAVIAAGARPFIPPVEGVHLKNVFTMRTPEDAVALREAVDSGAIKRAVIVGGGFIGLEVAENLVSQGIRVTVIDMAEHILPGFDTEMQEYVENHLAEQGIMTFSNTKLEGLEGTESVEKVLTNRRPIKADAVILAIGIRPNTEFLRDSGLDMMPNGTIRVSPSMQTNDPDIYAVGDCACVTDAVTGEPLWSPMGSSANIEGRIAARHIAGKSVAYRGAVGTGICKLPGLHAGRTGLTEAAAKGKGYDVISALVAVDDKAHYYPGAGTMFIKLVADRSSRQLLGAQVLGTDKVDTVLDIAVTGLYGHATVDQMADMDLAYAPPFSTAIHPFDHAINVLLNKMEGELQSFTPAEYEEGKAEGYRIVDTSQNPSIEGAEYVDLTKVNGVLPGWDPDAKLLLVCTKGRRAYLLQNRLQFYGYTGTKVLEGGTAFNGADLQ